MRNILDHHALIPLVKIDKPTLSRIQSAARMRTVNDGSVGLMVGKPNFTGETPLITFYKFDVIPSPDETPSLNLDEVPAYVLFQSGPIDELDEFVQDYIESNKMSKRYSSNYYYHPFCTATYTDELDLCVHLVAPNISLTITDANMNANSTGSTQTKQDTYATYSNPREKSAGVHARFLGVQDKDDPRILALSYSISLKYGNTPICAEIGQHVFQIVPSVSNTIYYYEGYAKVANGVATVEFKHQRSYALPADPAPDPVVAGAPVIPAKAALLRQIDEMGARIAELTDELQRQEEEFYRSVDVQEKERKALIERITRAVQKSQMSEGRRLARFVPPRQSITSGSRPKSRPAFFIEMTQRFERAGVQAFSGFPTAHLDSSRKPRSQFDASVKRSHYADFVPKPGRQLETRIANRKPMRRDLPAPLGPPNPATRMSSHVPSGSSHTQTQSSFGFSEDSGETNLFLKTLHLLPMSELCGCQRNKDRDADSALQRV
jgi:hypothetical protein